MKIVCLIFMLLPQLPDGRMPIAEAEKPFQSLHDCRAWAHQQEFQPPIGVPPGSVMITKGDLPPSGGTVFICLKFWEA